ncbi:MAG: thiamine phosphate synthase [Clostridia bacterium]|nr:thiamine phosphate synthase [Clostridia bacterium]
MKKEMRIIDANVNRVCEGLRVLEDLARFYFDNQVLSESIRIEKHKLRKMFSKYTLEAFRSVENDVGQVTSHNSQLDKKTSFDHLVKANCKRCQEGLRSIEEVLKNSFDYELGKNCETIRYFVYNLEKVMLKPVFYKTDLYGILGESYSKGRTNYEIAQEMLEAGIKVIQYREKDKSKKEQLCECQSICELAKKESALFIVNDHLDIAMASHAHGIHLGQDDLPVSVVKTIAPYLIIGKSTHNMAQVKEALEDQVDYIGVGPMFMTSTKMNIEASEGLKFLREVSETVKIPYVAIGGINETNIRLVSEFGACCAMISTLVGAENVKKNIQTLKESINE